MKKKAFTLLEILIVIFLITLITGAIGYNMRGALDRGKVFRTEQAQLELYDLLMLAVAQGTAIDEACSKPVKTLKKLGLAQHPEKLIQDGWGKLFKITPKDGSDIEIQSDALQEYRKKHGS